MRFDEQQQRTAFEQHVRSRGFDPVYTTNQHSEIVYCDERVEIAWQSWQAAIEQASQPQWIPVSEQLPQLADNVQIKTIRGEVLNARLQSDNDWFLIHWGQFVSTGYTDAWRIMPEAPEIAV